MLTVLFSKVGGFKVYIKTIPNRWDDNYHYYVVETDKSFPSAKRAIANAHKYLAKKRAKYYKKHPKPRVKTKRIISKEVRDNNSKGQGPKKLYKLYKMKKSTAKILVAHSPELIIKKEYARKKWDKSTTAIAGDTKDFSLAIASVMAKGTQKERKLVSKMLKKFVNEPYRKTNLFY